MDQIQEQALMFVELIRDYLRTPETLFQLGLTVVLVLIALLISRPLGAGLQRQAERIGDTRGLSRVFDAVLARVGWLLSTVVLAVAYLITTALGRPSPNGLLYAAMMLSGAGFVVAVLSRVLANRIVGRSLAVVVWLVVALSILGAFDDVTRILDTAAITLGSSRVSLLGLIQGVFFIVFLVWAAFVAGNFVDGRIQQIDGLTPSLRVLLGKIIRILLIVFAGMTAMRSLNIDITALTVLSGAVGVGIGFGLQKVVSNFISGIIILVDQSIKPGDTITLGETFGWIRELRARFVSVVTRDGREYLIPNEDFITTQVINWSFSDKFVRLDVPFGVSYDSDPHEVVRIAIEATAGVERVDSERKRPVCWMTEFGDSSINFLLRFWIDDPQQGLTNIRGKVMMALWDAFQENGIVIPYPHREVIVKTPIAVAAPEASRDAMD